MGCTGQEEAGTKYITPEAKKDGSERKRNIHPFVLFFQKAEATLNLDGTLPRVSLDSASRSDLLLHRHHPVISAIRTRRSRWLKGPEARRLEANWIIWMWIFFFFFLAVREGHTLILPPLRTRAEDQRRSRFSQQKSLNVGRLAQWLRGFWRMMKERRRQKNFIMIRRNNVGAQLSSSSLLAENNNVRLDLLGRFWRVTQSLWDSGLNDFWWRTHWLGPSEHWHFKIKLIN